MKLATVGTSWITEMFVDAGHKCENFEYICAYSRSEEKAASFAAKNGAGKYTFDFEKMLSDKDIDTVYIASPNSLHAEQSVAAMNAGKNVICEKPVASNITELKKMKEAADRNGVFFTEAYKSAFIPGFEKIRELIPQVGIIRNGFFGFSKYSSRYDAHKRGDNVNTFKSEFSNGALLDLGIYCIYPMLFYFGEPKSVSAVAAKLESGVDGAGNSVFAYGDFTVSLAYSKVGNSFLPSEIQGEDATIIANRINIPDEITLIKRNGEKTVFSVPHDENDMVYEVRHFIDCIDKGLKESPVISHRMSEICVRLCDEIRRQTEIIYPADLK